MQDNREKPSSESPLATSSLPRDALAKQRQSAVPSISSEFAGLGSILDAVRMLVPSLAQCEQEAAREKAPVREDQDDDEALSASMPSESHHAEGSPSAPSLTQLDQLLRHAAYFRSTFLGAWEALRHYHHLDLQVFFHDSLLPLDRIPAHNAVLSSMIRSKRFEAFFRKTIFPWLDECHKTRMDIVRKLVQKSADKRGDGVFLLFTVKVFVDAIREEEEEEGGVKPQICCHSQVKSHLMVPKTLIEARKAASASSSMQLDESGSQAQDESMSESDPSVAVDHIQVRHRERLRDFCLDDYQFVLNLERYKLLQGSLPLSPSATSSPQESIASVLRGLSEGANRFRYIALPKAESQLSAAEMRLQHERSRLTELLQAEERGGSPLPRSESDEMLIHSGSDEFATQRMEEDVDYAEFNQQHRCCPTPSQTGSSGSETESPNE